MPGRAADAERQRRRRYRRRQALGAVVLKVEVDEHALAGIPSSEESTRGFVPPEAADCGVIYVALPHVPLPYRSPQGGGSVLPPEPIPQHLHAARNEDPHGPTMHSPVRTNRVILGSDPNEPVGCH